MLESNRNSLPEYDFKFNIGYTRRLFLRGTIKLGNRAEEYTNVALTNVDTVISERAPDMPAFDDFEEEVEDDDDRYGPLNEPNFHEST
jgi:hypothetical protein